MLAQSLCSRVWRALRAAGLKVGQRSIEVQGNRIYRGEPTGRLYNLNPGPRGVANPPKLSEASLKAHLQDGPFPGDVAQRKRVASPGEEVAIDEDNFVAAALPILAIGGSVL